MTRMPLAGWLTGAQMIATTSKRRRVVVDGSNIATEGRTAPSLAQLDDAIRTFLDEYPGFTTGDVTVIVDATFGHRIDPSEQAAYEQALEHGEMLTPPAGAIGRGDGFILRIAEKSDAIVLSNDSFQEFHAERPWLFDPGRLMGGKPVPGVGWVFTPRTPVRGPRSRSVTARSKRGVLGEGGLADEADVVELPTLPAEESGTARKTRSGRAAKAGTSVAAKSALKAVNPRGSSRLRTEAATSKQTAGSRTTAGSKATKVEKAPKAPKAPKAAKTAKSAKTAKVTKSTKATKSAKATTSTKATKAKAAPTSKAMKTSSNKKVQGARPRTGKVADTQASSGRSESRPAAGNDPVTFLNFVADHPVGSTVEGTVAAFTSHGAQIDVDGMQCHVPLRGLGDPPPQRARQVLARGETRRFVLVSLDAARRRAELALAG
jgi:hypothetical protein